MGQQEILEHLDLRKDEEILWQGQPNTFKKLYKVPNSWDVFFSLLLFIALCIPFVLFRKGGEIALFITVGLVYIHFGVFFVKHFRNKQIMYFITNERIISFNVDKCVRIDFLMENIHRDKCQFKAKKDGSGFIWAGSTWDLSLNPFKSDTSHVWGEKYCSLVDISDVKLVYDILLSAVENHGHEEPISYNKLPSKW